MAESTQDAAIPRYLRYKSEDSIADGYWDEELERANSILHDRVVRMKRDKLCTRCARFDFLRTHFYTWNCTYKTKDQKRCCPKVKNDAKRPVMTGNPTFDGIEDNVPWNSFQIISGTRKEIKLLAQHPEFSWKLDSRHTIECALCEIVVSTAVACGLRERPPVTPGREDLNIRLRVGELYEAGGLHRCNESYSPYHNTVDLKNALEIEIWYVSDAHPPSDRLFIRPYAQEMKYLSDHTSESLPHCCILPHELHANVNLNICKTWIENCDEQHKHTWGPHTEPRRLSRFCLIDIKSQCIVEGGHDRRYAALSYTWGSNGQYRLTKSNKTFLEESGSLQKIIQELQPVVVDSITACARLQIPYLWIDALCIVQDDAAGKHHQIQNMDFIYASAYVTVVAAAERNTSIQPGRNTSVGLARVTVPSVQANPSFMMDGVAYAYWRKKWLPTNVESDLEDSTWFSRGWTFQELVLSRRMLVFTAREVFFYCPNGVLMESVSHNDDPCQPLALEMSRCIQFCGHLHNAQADESSTGIETSISSHRTYLRLLNSYSQRVLTYDDDVVNAFTGIMRAHSDVSGPLYWGIPQITLARGLTQQILRGSYSCGGQMYRRSDFPSWSLLGWTIADSEQNYPVFEYGSWDPQVALVHIYTYEQSSLRLLTGCWDEGTGIEGYSPQSIEYYNISTNLEALPIQPCIGEIPPQLVSLLGQFAGPVLLFWTHVARFPPKDSLVPNQRYPRFSDDRSGELKEVDAQVEVILIATCVEHRIVVHDESKWGIYAELYGIVVERHLGCARRIGTVSKMRVSEWLRGNPKKELVALI